MWAENMQGKKTLNSMTEIGHNGDWKNAWLKNQWKQKQKLNIMVTEKNAWLKTNESKSRNWT